MKAYTFSKTKVTDREQYLKYVKAVQPLAERWGRKFLVCGCPIQALEGSSETVDDGNYYMLLHDSIGVASY